MRKLFQIVRLDLRRLRGLYVTWLLVLSLRWVLAKYVEPIPPDATGVGLFFGLDLIILALGFSLICLLVLEHSPSRTRSPWHTRPMSRSVVVTAKLAFWLVFLALPFLWAKASVAAHLGLKGWLLVDLLLWPNVVLGLQVSALAFAAAALTRRFREAVVAGFLLRLAALWAFAVPTFLLKLLRDSSEGVSLLAVMNSSLLVTLAPIIGAAGAVVLLFWKRGRWGIAVAFLLCSSTAMGLLSEARPDLPAWKFFSQCRGADLPEDPIRLSLDQRFEFELPPGAEIEEPGKKGIQRIVDISLGGESEAEGVLFEGTWHKAQLQWPGGESRTHVGEMTGDWAFGSLLGAATEAEEIFQGKPFQHNYLNAWFGAEPREIERLGDLPAEYLGTLELTVFRYGVLAELPLEKGAAEQGNGVAIRIDDVDFEEKGVGIVINDRFARSFSSNRPLSGYGLLNRQRGEVFKLYVPRSRQRASTRTIWGWEREARKLHPYVKYLEGSAINEEWVRGATLVAFEKVCLGRSKQSLRLADFRLAERTSEVNLAKMKERKRRSDEEKARKAEAENP